MTRLYLLGKDFLLKNQISLSEHDKCCERPVPKVEGELLKIVKENGEIRNTQLIMCSILLVCVIIH